MNILQAFSRWRELERVAQAVAENGEKSQNTVAILLQHMETMRNRVEHGLILQDANFFVGLARLNIRIERLSADIVDIQRRTQELQVTLHTLATIADALPAPYKALVVGRFRDGLTWKALGRTVGVSKPELNRLWAEALARIEAEHLRQVIAAR